MGVRKISGTVESIGERSITVDGVTYRISERKQRELMPTTLVILLSSQTRRQVNNALSKLAQEGNGLPVEVTVMDIRTKPEAEPSTFVTDMKFPRNRVYGVAMMIQRMIRDASYQGRARLSGTVQYLDLVDPVGNDVDSEVGLSVRVSGEF